MKKLYKTHRELLKFSFGVREAGDENDFDFYSSDGLSALEVTYGMTPQQTSSLSLDCEAKNKKQPDLKLVKGLSWHGWNGCAQLTTLDGYIEAIKNSISLKNKKW